MILPPGTLVKEAGTLIAPYLYSEPDAGSRIRDVRLSGVAFLLATTKGQIDIADPGPDDDWHWCMLLTSSGVGWCPISWVKAVQTVHSVR